jgi:hypothetical protein
VNEDVFAATFLLDEAKALAGVEELDDALALANDLSGHATASAATATRAAKATAAATRARTAAEAATITAAEAATVSAASESVTATAETIAATAEAVTTAAHERVEIILSETVTLVASPAATSSIETHKPAITFASPSHHCPDGADETRRATGQAATFWGWHSPLHSLA